MDGLKAVFYCLLAVFLYTVAYMHTNELNKPEGFIDTPVSSDVEKKIRSVLDPYLNSDMCDIYTEVRNIVAQSIQGNANPPTEDTKKKVEAYLKKEIGLPPLPCPAFTYPTAKAEIEWLVFLNGIPSTIAASYILMAIYAQRELKFRAGNVRTALDRGVPVPEDQKDVAETTRLQNAREESKKTSGMFGKAVSVNKYILTGLPTEGFETIIGLCPATIQDSRRAEKANASCTMPEDMSHEEIVRSVDTLLQKISADKKSILTEKYISPDIDVSAFVRDAKVNSDYLKKMKAKALDGSLVYEMTP